FGTSSMSHFDVILAVWLTVLAGSIIQSSVGFGIGLMAGPIATMVDPHLMPEVVIIPTITLASCMTISERRHIDLKGLTWAFLGLIPGVMSGVYIVTILSAEQLSLGVAGVV